MAAFGPILEPAFVEDYPARIHLAEALNHVGRRCVARGLASLDAVRKRCITTEDEAAILFVMGLCGEMEGDRERMAEWYERANRLGHGFYLPYLKVAKFYLEGHLYERAEENFREGIRCLAADEVDEQKKQILGSAYANLASCLTMMHRYEEADALLAEARRIYPAAPGYAAVEAVLYSIRGDVEQTEASLNELKAYAPAVYAAVKERADKILAHKDPQFYPDSMDEGVCRDDI